MDEAVDRLYQSIQIRDMEAEIAELKEIIKTHDYATLKILNKQNAKAIRDMVEKMGVGFVLANKPIIFREDIMEYADNLESNK